MTLQEIETAQRWLATEVPARMHFGDVEQFEHDCEAVKTIVTALKAAAARLTDERKKS